MSWFKQTLRTLGNATGQRAEHLAERYLIQQGLTLAARNYRVKRGEIDLIMWHQSTLVFVEVRFRASAQFGSATESIDARKQQRIRHAAEHYLHTHHTHDTPACRFDAVCIDGAAQNEHHPHLSWIENAF